MPNMDRVQVRTNITFVSSCPAHLDAWSFRPGTCNLSESPVDREHRPSAGSTQQDEGHVPFGEATGILPLQLFVISVA